ncbi:hypothetical protein FOL47_007915 [Perkinsus chesapeaki]|uniref:Uncharacterized protein n=1 Tax=Perkinsus chesapeaki TaxID=330153 RepID=A0A7J6LGZ1_PERCH|nr:hypothetical protein FOL47_007915 [Perkinsus chesapeaki]
MVSRASIEFEAELATALEKKLKKDNSKPHRQSRIVKDAEQALLAMVARRQENRRQISDSRASSRKSSECAESVVCSLDSSSVKVEAALAALDVQIVDVGRDEMYNQCFYLSLAASWLATISEGFIDLQESADLIKETALSLKRFIEGRVLESHPQWSETGQVGENIQAFSDFLPYAMCRRRKAGTRGPMDDLCIFVISEVGQADLYIGRKFSDKKSDVILVYHTPGHYQCILQSNGLPMKRNNVKNALEKWGVIVVETRDI